MPNRRFLSVSIIVAVSVLFAHADLVAGTPPSAPVQITFSTPPSNMQPGDVVDTTITITATADLSQLHVAVYAVEGITLLSGEVDDTSTDVAAKTSKQFTARVRLDAATGTLAVAAETELASGASAARVTEVVYE